LVMIILNWEKGKQKCKKSFVFHIFSPPWQAPAKQRGFCFARIRTRRAGEAYAQEKDKIAKRNGREMGAL
ncbi:MAG: hypothetical protein LBB94_05460, partial [Clostridiales bacterium]|nr:hypothetical protein [Clostridiales bacterium]